MSRSAVSRVLVSFLTIFAINGRSASAEPRLTTRHRHPVAAATIDGGRKLIVANRRSGTVSIVDPLAGQVTCECQVGRQLSDIVATTNSKRFLVTDDETHELIALQVSDNQCRVEKRLSVNSFPVSVRVSADGTRAFVASLWTKSLTVVRLDEWLSSDGSSDVIDRVISLPFAPREQIVIEVSDQQQIQPPPGKIELRLVVADAFGSKLAVIDPTAGSVLSVREFSGHAVRCIRMHPDTKDLLMTHQMTGRTASTGREDIHWGGLMLNCLRSVNLGELLSPDVDRPIRESLDYIGGPDRGAGDPAGFFVMPNGSIALALAGTDELLIDQRRSLMFTSRVKTQACPVAVLAISDGSRLCVVNALDDSITVVRNGGFDASHVSLGPRPELTDADRGERLFHSAKLSHDHWISCASCHVDGHSNGLLIDNTTDGTYGSAKRILSLKGVSQTAPYSWNGRFATLAEQIEFSMQATMQGPAPTESQSNELVAYLRTLPPVPVTTPVDRRAIERGRQLFDTFECRQCHAPPRYTTSRSVDVGITDEMGNSHFNPPSLQGVQHNGPYFHDGRARTLESVFQKFNHQLPREITEKELSELVSFLRSL